MDPWLIIFCFKSFTHYFLVIVYVTWTQKLPDANLQIFYYYFYIRPTALISILIRSNDKMKNIFIYKPPRVFLQVSRPMFLTLRNAFNIILTDYYPSGWYKSNMAAVYNDLNSKIIITQQMLKIHSSFICLDPCFQP